MYLWNILTCLYYRAINKYIQHYKECLHVYLLKLLVITLSNCGIINYGHHSGAGLLSLVLKADRNFVPFDGHYPLTP